MIHLSPMLMLASIGLLGFISQMLADRLKLPAILFLLVIGLLLGPILEVFNPDQVFGELLFPFVSLSVAVILFEGALTLSVSELKEIGRPVLNMVSYGILINAFITTIATHYLVGLSWELSALFGAIMVVTGPTVIMPMLRAVRPQPKIGDALRWEGIVIDPIGALFAVLIYEFIVVQQTNSDPIEVVTVFAGTIAVGGGIGAVGGYLFGLLLRSHRIPEGLQNFAALALVCFVFAISDSLMHESGLLAVTLMGLVLANMSGVNIRSILGFKEDLTLVLVSSLFIILAARVEFAGLQELGYKALFVLIAIQFIARPLKVFISFIGSEFSMPERAMVAWMGPRGIVAAAVVAVFAIRLEELGFSKAPLLVPLAFTVIIGTVVIQSLTARPLARMLKVNQPATDGILIIGANEFSIALASTLDRLGISVLVCDSTWDKLRRARELGLQTYHGNPSSNHAERYLSLNHYGIMLGLASHHDYNVVQAARFSEEFGNRNVFILASHRLKGNVDKHVTKEEFSGRVLFGLDLDFFTLRRKVASDGKIKVTRLSENYDFDSWSVTNPDAVLLFVIAESGEISFSEPGNELEVKAGDSIAYLVSEK